MPSDSFHTTISQGAEDQPSCEGCVETLSRTLVAIIKTDPVFTSVIEDMIGRDSQIVTVTHSGTAARPRRQYHRHQRRRRDLVIGAGLP
jgi:hypothetical protein